MICCGTSLQVVRVATQSDDDAAEASYTLTVQGRARVRATEIVSEAPFLTVKYVVLRSSTSVDAPADARERLAAVNESLRSIATDLLRLFAQHKPNDARTLTVKVYML